MSTNQAILPSDAAIQAAITRAIKAPAFSARLTSFSSVAWAVSQLRAAGRVATVTARNGAWRVTA